MPDNTHNISGPLDHPYVNADHQTRAVPVTDSGNADFASVGARQAQTFLPPYGVPLHHDSSYHESNLSEIHPSRDGPRIDQATTEVDQSEVTQSGTPSRPI